MKLKNLILSMSAGAFALSMASCENGDATFPDYDGGVSVYFPYQYPIRTIILGDINTYDNSKENNEHKFTIYSTMGGSYSGKNIDVNVAVDESLLNGLKFASNGEAIGDVKMMPSEYFSLSDNTMHFGGKMRGGIDVQLNDAFFADPKSTENTYVIPLVMTQATGQVKRILTGTPSSDNAVRQDNYAWSTAPKDFTICCVNFINKFDGNYLRRGVDNIATVTRKGAGNKVISLQTGNQVEHPWDNQFWIKSDIAFEEGKEWSIKMKVKADKEASIGTQTHKGVGGYIHWAAIGNVNFTNEWKEFTANGKFSSEQNGGDCIAFNLNIGEDNKPAEDANTYYFDDIEFIVDGKVAAKYGEAGGYATKANIGADAGQQKEFPFWEIDPNNTKNSTASRHTEYVETDQVVRVSTKSLNSVVMPVTGLKNGDEENITCNLLLTFDGDNCTISSATEGFEAEGSGTFKTKSEAKAWGNIDRDALYLNYTIKLGASTYSTVDTLVARDRGNAASIREFQTIYQPE